MIKYHLIIYSPDGDPLERIIYDDFESAKSASHPHLHYEIQDVVDVVNKDDFRCICELFGGQTATSKILGLSSARNLRKVIKGDLKVPNHWIEKLKKIALDKSEELVKFHNS